MRRDSLWLVVVDIFFFLINLFIRILFKMIKIDIRMGGIDVKNLIYKEKWGWKIFYKDV